MLYLVKNKCHFDISLSYNLKMLYSVILSNPSRDTSLVNVRCHSFTCSFELCQFSEQNVSLWWVSTHTRTCARATRTFILTGTTGHNCPTFWHPPSAPKHTSCYEHTLLACPVFLGNIKLQLSAFNRRFHPQHPDAPDSQSSQRLSAALKHTIVQDLCKSLLDQTHARVHPVTWSVTRTATNTHCKKHQTN